MTQEEYQIECMTRDLVLILMNKHNLSIEDSLSFVYNSQTYSKLKDPLTGLYYQSPYYVYDYLNNEYTLGKMQ